MQKCVLFVVLALVAGMASANDAQVDVDSGVSFTDQRDRILAQMDDGETYAELTAADRGAVMAALGRMEGTLEAGGIAATVATVTPQQRIDLLNDQSLVNNILTQAGEDSRMVCRREAPVGTRMARSQCLTVAERRRRREDAQQRMEANKRGMEGLLTR